MKPTPTTGSHLEKHAFTGAKHKSWKKFQQFPADQQVQVFYDPDDPGDSVLVPGTKNTIDGIIFGIVLILIALLGLGLSLSLTNLP